MLRTSHTPETIQRLVDIYARAVVEVEKLQDDLHPTSCSVTLARRAGMDSLPSELIGAVFEHVSDGSGREALSLSQVNQRWRAICNATPLAWNILNVTWKTRLEWIELVIARAKSFLVVEVSLSNVNRYADQAHHTALCRAVLPHSQKWQKYTGFRYPIWKAAGGGDSIEAPKLTVFGLSGELGDCGLDLSNFRSITRLNFGYMVNMTNVAQKCSALFDTVVDLKCHPSPNLEFLSLFTNLERLKFWSDGPRRLDTPLILPTVKEIHSFSGCLDAFLLCLTAPNLTAVSIAVNPSVSRIYTSRLPISKFPNLLDVSYKLTLPGRIEWHEATFSEMEQIQRLRLENVTHLDETLAPWKDGSLMPKLSCLELRNCQNITMQILEHIAARSPKPSVQVINSQELFQELRGEHNYVLCLLPHTFRRNTPLLIRGKRHRPKENSQSRLGVLHG